MKPILRLSYTLALATMAMGWELTHSHPVLSCPGNCPQTQGNDVSVILSNNIELNRAKNLARSAAIAANGGLDQYRPEDAMHGPAMEAPFVDNENGTWTFFIKGRSLYSNVYTIETIVTVSQDGKLVTVNYNGPIRDR